jgi:hypothetical protein
VSVPVETFRLEDYKLHVQALANQYTRLWTRFNFFLTIHSALLVTLVGFYKDERLTWPALPIALLGVLMSVLWYVAGAQDRYLVVFYRAMITHAARRAVHDDDWAHPGLSIKSALDILDRAGHAPEVRRGPLPWRMEAISVTKLPALVPLIVGALWLFTAIAMVVAL